MSLLINQGKQDSSNDNTFEPIEEKDVVSVVEKIELNKYLPGNIDVTFRLMNGQHKNWTRKDTVPYEASNAMSWKYRALRNCCGAPYQENEPVTIDIEKLIKDKILIVDFSITEKDGKKYQKCTYRKIDQQHLDLAFPKAEYSDEDEISFDTQPTQPTKTVEVSQPVQAPVGVEETQITQVTTSLPQNDDDEWE